MTHTIDLHKCIFESTYPYTPSVLHKDTPLYFGWAGDRSNAKCILYTE